jgi:outer membrane receptor protein involved in Fe transport
VELDVAGDIVRNVRLSAAYAYTDATVTQGDHTIVTGSRFPNVPRHSATVLIAPRFALAGGEATLGGAVNYVGARMGDVAASSNFVLPAYTTARLLAAYAPTPGGALPSISTTCSTRPITPARTAECGSIRARSAMCGCVCVTGFNRLGRIPPQ